MSRISTTTWEDGGSNEEPGETDRVEFGLRTGREILDYLGSRLAPGAVFRIEDRFTQPLTASGKSHPYVIVGGVPPLTDTPDEAVARRVLIACRESWKVDRHGELPTTEEAERRLLEENRRVFSRRGTLRGCDRDGLFHIRHRRLVLIRRLASCPFLGWLPKPAVDWLLTHMAGTRVPDPYPPT